MAYELQPGQGTLFEEKNKKHERAPDRNGQLILDRDYKAGEMIKLSGWTKRGSYGELISIRINSWKPGDAGVPAKEVYKADEDVPF